ncbi:interferon-induced very large GTPase 1-like [Carassius auratus]|uniref:Interferon-induced very large GTPase 1-like n=1 Tax=Carassius auratus TaxID=7957 RepID=A0A6P6NIU9_CARAU|nr:interferon-induced very large GTPase 1-like [Carassius auratus]XP_026108908.1 interferon-induced very large GTPase 1-like [Carassius auratus]
MDCPSEEEEFADASEYIEDEQQTFTAGAHAVKSYQNEDVSMLQDIHSPNAISVQLIGTSSVTLAWDSPDNITTFELTYYSLTSTKTTTITHSSTIEVEDLCPGTEYTFSLVSVSDSGECSVEVKATACTRPLPPENFKVESVGTNSVSLIWDASGSEESSFHVACSQNGRMFQEKMTNSRTMDFCDLSPGKKYCFNITKVLPNGNRSKEAVTYAQTKTNIQSLLQELGLEKYYPNKLSLNDVLQIEKRSVTDEPAQSLSSLPWLFLKKLMMVNVTARSVKCSSDESEDLSSLDFNNESFDFLNDQYNSVNPLDIVSALFLCSDGFLQQEMVSKMSMCQFSVPLLLPNSDTHQCMLMLWAMRDIVKKCRPHYLSDPRGFVEERIVHFELPLVSFVRLGDCSISKSQILNKLLSNPQQYHDTFVHRDMDCGDIPRKISNGLVEMSWYLPCGNKNIDVFPEPVAVANLRGDISTFETQYTFLCQTSTAVFVFFDNLDTNYKLLTNQHAKAQFFLVGNVQNKAFDFDQLKRTASEMSLKKNNIILKTNQNDANFVKNLHSSVNLIINNHSNKARLEGMDSIAHELGILVDEDIQECQNAKDNAHALTENIKDTLQFKQTQLPLQGKIWKDLAKLEKEECRLRKAGDQNIEAYKSDLQIKKTELRKQQSKYDISNAMSCFVSALSSSNQERSYFLKWMRMNLDNISRKNLSSLRELYKEKCQQFLENKEEIARLDQQISNSSLGVEHFLREMGQLYEAAVSLPENIQSRKQMLHLPRLCAQLMLDGFPLELVDGDASNIPLRWVSDVLMYLNSLVQPNNKIIVVTVLGVQSTGKSTLLNTMFGVQFAVSSGRCTRGAFMQLIKVTKDIKRNLGCDYLVIIDTEGLKSPELAKLDDSHEHDNELATLVVGLSDITIINIAMENSTEMKDILQIVVHAFLRMKEIGKKPKCQFVHQNVADVSAHDKNMRDRKLLLEQLNEMTEAAAKMENKEEYKMFTDVMEYDPETCNWYIPGLWHGNPPMAPVNAGYSESVYDLKKNMIDVIGECKLKTSGNNITEFLDWTKSLWNAVKYENFIFSFRNSLVADAYMRLCAEFHKWEWSFKKHMHSWLTEAETTVSNFEMMKLKSDKSDMQNLLCRLKQEAVTKLDSLEKKTMENLSKYFEQTEGHVYLVEKFKEDFVSSVKSLRRETESSLLTHLEATVEIRKGMDKLDYIKKTFTDTMEKKVLGLLEELRKNSSMRKIEKSDVELNNIFEKIWEQTVSELSVCGFSRKNIFDSIFKQLRNNLKQKGGFFAEQLNQVKPENCGREPFKVTTETFFKKVKRYLFQDDALSLQDMADNIIQECGNLIQDKAERHSDYHDTFIQDILNIIDERLTSHKKMGFSDKFELSLKLHICGMSAREFQRMHDHYIKENDPQRCICKVKDKYRNDFKDLFHDRDQCQRKAEQFTTLCLKPAVESFIYSSLGPDIIDAMLQGKHAFQFSTRAFFQYSLLKQLLNEDNFENYVKFICSYEGFVKCWILDQITEQLSHGEALFEIEERHLRLAKMEILEAIKTAQNETKENDVKKFIHSICRKLGKRLVIPKDALETVMVLNNASQEPFACSLNKSVEELEKTLKKQLKKVNIQGKLSKLKMKPQDELFKRVFGCGKQCPFCRAPCEAGGEAHSEHCASVHRPQGLGRYRYVKNEQLVTSICSTNVHSEVQFRCLQTNNEYHPYKRYREIFPDWHIPADPSIQASDYWKYVMVRFNNQFAKHYNALPADIPLTWEYITKQQAEDSLKESFSIK